MDISKTHIEKDYKADRPLLSCCFSRDGKHVFVGSEDYKVWRYQVSDGAKVEFDTEAWVRALCISQDDKTLITGGYDGRLIWWNAKSETSASTKAIDAHDGWIRTLALSPDGKTLASVGNDKVVKLWDSIDGSLKQELNGHESYVYNVVFHPDGKSLITGDLYGNIFDWDLTSGDKKRSWVAETLTKYDKSFRAQIGGFRGMIFNDDGTQLICSGITNVSNAFAGIGNPSVVVFDYAKGEQIIEHLSKGPLKGVAWNVALHPEKFIISSTGGSGGYLLFWKPGEKEPFHQLKMPSDVRDLALSPKGTHVAAVHSNSHLSICKLDEKSA